MFTEGLFEDISTGGFTVVPGVLSEGECDAAVAGLWDRLEGFGTGIDRKNSKTWSDKAWPVSTRGIIEYPSLSHAQPVWDVRENKNVREVFSEMWRMFGEAGEVDVKEPDDLLVSFDRVNIMRPPELVPGGGGSARSWAHVDQSSRQKGLRCVQGFVNLEETDHKDGAFVAYQFSHLLHEKFFRDHGIDSGPKDWYKFSPEELEWFDDVCVLTRVRAPKGALVLWDSRTIHYNAPPILPRPAPRFRHAVYVCMTPREWASDAALKKKREAFANLRTTSHWPHKITLQGGTKPPYNYGKPVPAFRVEEVAPTISDKRLAGFDK